jgi:PAT family beta-lactamase induction signal transducer AmpG
MSTAQADETKKPRFIRAMRALKDRRMAAMFLLALAAGIPYGSVLGTLFAWLTTDGINPREIGALSMVILVYSYKYLWAPSFQRARSPLAGFLGPRRQWLLLCEAAIAIGLAIIALSSPAENIGTVAVIALVVAGLSATHDIVLDAWRIEIARSDEDKDLMSALYQFGHRLGGLLTGALALVLYTRIGWEATYLLMAGVMVVTMIGVFVAPEPDHAQFADSDGIRPSFGPGLPLQTRRYAVGAVAAAWAIAIFMIAAFVSQALTASPPPSGTGFIKVQGPIIVLLSVILPAIIAAALLRGNASPIEHAPAITGRLDTLVDSLFRSILDPLMDLISRLGWGVIIVLGLVLSYRFADLVWGAFAYPFYLGLNFGALGHSGDEIALASKTFGVIMTMSGSALGATALLFIGRMPCLLIGAILAAVTNLLFADLAAGGQGLQGFLDATHLNAPYEWIIALTPLEATDKLVRLMAAITAENLSVGFASVAIVAYLTSIVNPRFAAVQYALLGSLVMLIGSLGRAPIGDMMETQGFEAVFILTFQLGLVAVLFTLLEWARQTWWMPKTTEIPVAA